MINRINVQSKIADARAEVFKKHLEKEGFKGRINRIWLVDVYTVDKNLKRADLEKIATILANPVTQRASINGFQASGKLDWVIEFGFLPGVTDNVANTTQQSIEDLLRIRFSQNEGVYTS